MDERDKNLERLIEQEQKQREEDPIFRIVVSPMMTVIGIILLSAFIIFSWTLKGEKETELQISASPDVGLRHHNFVIKAPSGQLITVNFFYIKGAMKDGQAQFLKDTLEKSVRDINKWDWDHGPNQLEKMLKDDYEQDK